MLLTSFDEVMYVFARSHPNTVLWTAITLLGDTLTLAAVVVTLLLIYKRPRTQFMLLTSLLSAILLSTALKYLFGRVRPDEATLTTPSFPSGHTLGATAVYGMLAYILWTGGRKRQAAALLLVPIMVGISRIMLSEHWATDVFGGWMLGAILVAVITVGTSRLQRSAA